MATKKQIQTQARSQTKKQSQTSMKKTTHGVEHKAHEGKLMVGVAMLALVVVIGVVWVWNQQLHTKAMLRQIQTQIERTGNQAREQVRADERQILETIEQPTAELVVKPVGEVIVQTDKMLGKTEEQLRAMAANWQKDYQKVDIRTQHQLYDMLDDMYEDYDEWAQAANNHRCRGVETCYDDLADNVDFAVDFVYQWLIDEYDDVSRVSADVLRGGLRRFFNLTEVDLQKYAQVIGYDAASDTVKVVREHKPIDVSMFRLSGIWRHPSSGEVVLMATNPTIVRDGCIDCQQPTRYIVLAVNPTTGGYYYVREMIVNQ